MTAATIILPENFKRPRYFGGAWLDHWRHWTAEDLTLLHAACDLGIHYEAAASTLGRPPKTLLGKAYELCLRIPKKWREVVYTPRKRSPKINLAYPYIIQPKAEHADLIAVNRMVAREMPGREDVCQDIMLALWDSRTSLAELRADPRALRSFIKAFRKAAFERSGHGVESMDTTLYSDGGNGKSKYEDARYQRTLVNNDDQFLEWNVFGKRHHEDKVDDELAREEESLGVPAAFWMRAELS